MSWKTVVAGILVLKVWFLYCGKVSFRVFQPQVKLAKSGFWERKTSFIKVLMNDEL